MFKLTHWILVALAFFTPPLTIARAEIYVFGDSLSETGNFYLATGGTLPPSPLYFEGRFSNGYVWVEHLARFIGEPMPTPSLLGGTNNSANGARAAGASPYGTPPLTDQVSSYLASSGGIADPSDTYILWAGANDIFFGVSAGEQDAITNAVDGIRSSVESLYAAGARKFVILDLPALGQTPFFNSSAQTASQLDAATAAFNSELTSALRSLKNDLPGARIASPKISKLFQSMRRAPILFGLRNVRDSATLFEPVTGIGFAPKPGANPDKYLFWDSVHPTTKVHGIIASYVIIDYILHCE